MRAAPPLAFTVRRFGAWRAVLVALALAGCATTAAWWHAVGPFATGLDILVNLACLACALLPLVEACRLHAWLLRWDGALWHVGRATVGTDELRTGRLRVVLDLGPWLLLRFAAGPAPRPDARPRRGSSAWIALQRQDLEAEWHAIRCTLYSPPPAGMPGGIPSRTSE